MPMNIHKTTVPEFSFHMFFFLLTCFIFRLQQQFLSKKFNYFNTLMHVFKKYFNLTGKSDHVDVIVYGLPVFTCAS